MTLVDSIVSFEYLDTNNRKWTIGKVTSVENGACSVLEYRENIWESLLPSCLDAEIDHSEKNIEVIAQCCSKGAANNTEIKSSLKDLSDVESLKRRLESLKKLKSIIKEGRYNDAKGRLFCVSSHSRQICISNIIEKLASKDTSFVVIDEEDALRFDSPGINGRYFSRFDIRSPQKLQELKFFDSRWPWDSRWPTIVTNHLAFFSWSGFENILRSKPEETRTTFVAEAAFCCQVPLHCVIDTHFSATESEFTASFKVVHHPSVEPSELDVRISQHPFWSMIHLRDANLGDKRGLDRVAANFMSFLGAKQGGESGMYFSQVLESLPRTNFICEREAYESELMEMILLCDRLNSENTTLQKSVELCRNELASSYLMAKREETVSADLLCRVNNAESASAKIQEENAVLINKLNLQEELIQRLRETADKSAELSCQLNQKTQEHNDILCELQKILGTSCSNSNVVQRIASMRDEFSESKRREHQNVEKYKKRVHDLEEELSNLSKELGEKVNTRSDMHHNDEKVEELQSEIKEILFFHEQEMKELEKELEEKSDEISDLLERVEEMSVMVEEARKGEEQALQLRMQSDTEVFRLQRALDITKYGRQNEPSVQE